MKKFVNDPRQFVPEMLKGLALAADAAAGGDDAAQDIVRDLHAAQVQPVLDPQEPAIDERLESLGHGLR